MMRWGVVREGREGEEEEGQGGGGGGGSSSSQSLSAALVLAPMQQLVDAKGPEDDWTGLGDRAERRRRQNRLNVRAHRRRKAAASQQGTDNHHHHHHNNNTHLQQQDSSALLASPRRTLLLNPGHPGKTPTTTPRRTRNQSQPTPLFPFSFPLSLDHLIPLVEYNIWRASLTNISILSVFSLLTGCTCSSSSSSSPPPLFPRAGGGADGSPSSSSSSVPPSLAPTALQRRTPHETWIDILPSPQMRDNAIVATRAGRLRNEVFCRDILRGLCAGEEGGGGGGEETKEDEDEDEEDEDRGGARLLVWTNPWEAAGWEVTEWFLRKYGFLVKGCEDMRTATDRWRAARGHEPIVWEVE